MLKNCMNFTLSVIGRVNELCLFPVIPPESEKVSTRNF